MDALHVTSTQTNAVNFFASETSTLPRAAANPDEFETPPNQNGSGAFENNWATTQLLHKGQPGLRKWIKECGLHRRDKRRYDKTQRNHSKRGRKSTTNLSMMKQALGILSPSDARRLQSAGKTTAS